MESDRFPFLFGSQYYRAPTPDPSCWEIDLHNLRKLGFNAVKYFVQWRWSHRSPQCYFFDDLDQLMDLAGKNELGVTLNFILDVSPVWLYEMYPDAKQVDNHGRTIEPYAVSHRQVGGHPGPCYRHPGALIERQHFLEAAVEHFRTHPAMQMWDVWNEPELCFPQRTPDLDTMVCYCPYCHAGFINWLQLKYGRLDRLNEVWGRPYETWKQVEMPRDTGTITDFIDWREFHLDTMAGEAAWRLDTVRRLDPEHGRYLHVVPNSYFSAVTCADDFAMAEACEVFAATMTGGPTACIHVISAGHGKTCYNVESHINHGCTDLHQPVIELQHLQKDLLPQIGMGIKGFLFWQYRSEVLGFEAPAWGIVKADGSPRPVTTAVDQFWSTLQPHASEIWKTLPVQAEVGVWRSRKNEIFHFCLQKQVRSFNTSIDAYIQALYWNNFPFRLINDRMLTAGDLDGLKCLILPIPYYLTQEEIDSLDDWVQNGGVLLCEAHLAGYNGSIGRHSQTSPGGGLGKSWGLYEVATTSPIYLRDQEAQKIDSGALTEDVRKALKEFGMSGGEFFPICMTNGSLAWGAHRYAELAAEGDWEPLGSFAGATCLARKPVGKGQVFYCGTNLGQSAERDSSGLEIIVHEAMTHAGVKPVGGLHAGIQGTVHLDILSIGDRPCYAVLINRASQDQIVQIDSQACWEGLFSGLRFEMNTPSGIVIPADFIDIFSIDNH